MTEWIDVAPVASLAPGDYKVVDIDDVEIAVFNVDGDFYALQDVCTHDGEKLTGGPVQGDQVTCPRHGARFCIKTGAVLCPPAYQPVTTFPVRVENGVIQVRDHRWD